MYYHCPAEPGSILTAMGLLSKEVTAVKRLNSSVFSLSFTQAPCLSHSFIAVKRHHDQDHVYKIKHLIRDLLTVSEGWSIAQWQGYGRSMGTLMALGQHLRITS